MNKGLGSETNFIHFFCENELGIVSGSTCHGMGYYVAHHHHLRKQNSLKVQSLSQNELHLVDKGRFESKAGFCSLIRSKT